MNNSLNLQAGEFVIIQVNFQTLQELLNYWITCLNAPICSRLSWLPFRESFNQTSSIWFERFMNTSTIP